MQVTDLETPMLVVDGDAFTANVATMAAHHPGTALRPHVKAFKSTALARELVAAGHPGFCAATLRELEGMADAGLGDDLLLANQTLATERLAALAARGDCRLTVAVDSPETISVAAEAGATEVLIDVEVGMPRCGCHPDEAGALADAARAAGLAVRGVMGYEGHLMTEPIERRAVEVAQAMSPLQRAAADVGGAVISGGGTGTFACNDAITELQAGSYVLMDHHYGAAGLPFAQALFLEMTIISAEARGRWAVGDGGLKALGMDHGDPVAVDPGLAVWFCSDEHTTLGPAEPGGPLPAVGDRVRLVPGHVDPTVAMHPELVVTTGPEAVEVADRWPVDLRGW